MKQRKELQGQNSRLWPTVQFSLACEAAQTLLNAARLQLSDRVGAVVAGDPVKKTFAPIKRVRLDEV